MVSFIDASSAFAAYSPFLGITRTGRIGLPAEVQSNGTFLPERPLPEVLTPLQDPFASRLPLVQSQEDDLRSLSIFALASESYARQNFFNAARLAGDIQGGRIDISG